MKFYSSMFNKQEWLETDETITDDSTCPYIMQCPNNVPIILISPPDKRPRIDVGSSMKGKTRPWIEAPLHFS